jgi:hypothetical protein
VWIEPCILYLPHLPGFCGPSPPEGTKSCFQYKEGSVSFCCGSQEKSLPSTGLYGAERDVTLRAFQEAKLPAVLPEQLVPFWYEFDILES